MESTTKEPVVVKIHGGLGNQFFQYALGRCLKVAHGLEVSFDVGWYQTQSLRTYDLDKYNVQVEPAEPALVSEFYRAKPTGLQGKIGSWLFPSASQYLLDHSLRYNPRVLAIKPPMYLDGYWQSEKYFAEIAGKIRKELTLKTEATGENAALLRQIKAAPTVSLHVRRGDYVSNQTTNAFHGTTTNEYYRAAVEKIKSVEPGATIYVFSDDHTWVKENLRFDLRTVFVDVNSANQAHEDLRLMSACTHHIIANSTFSWWGAWLSQADKKVIIAPKRWFADQRINTDDLVPNQWIRI